uniref:HEAT repeat domain-containing protein n=1 Tax=uncultured Thiotrichaceae bacterium TaxID=298394 RepID=A0A6S6UJ48_9GAMM|nr:MAG: Unknown protein [uncultured Thiotrichaceae bacterium]
MLENQDRIIGIIMKPSLHLMYISIACSCFLSGWYLAPLTQDETITPQIKQKLSPSSSPQPDKISSIKQDEVTFSAFSEKKPINNEKQKAKPLSKPETYALTAEECVKVPLSIKEQEAQPLAEAEMEVETPNPVEQERYQLLANLASKTGILAAITEIPAAEANGDIYRAIEQQLLTTPIEDTERLDLIDEYFNEYQGNISPEFIASLTNYAYQMETGDQAYWLELMQQHSAATRDSESPDYRLTLAESLTPFKYSEDEEIRYAALLAISDAIDEEESREQELTFFLSDPSEVVRAQALIKLHQTNQ